MRGIRHVTVGAAFLALACGVGQAFGLPPVALSVVALVTWALVASRRVGWLLGVSATVVGWMVLLLGASAVAHVGVPASVVASTALVVATFGAALVARRHPPVEPKRTSIVPLAAASVGAAVWTAALLLGEATGRGAGLSWVMYKDSTMNLWGVRRMLAAGGIDSFTAGANIQPLQDALSLALVPTGTGVTASSADVEGAIVGYASLWAVLIGCASVLIAAIVAMSSHGSPRSGWVLPVASAVASLALLGAPVTGVLIDFGQVNGHVMLVLIAASVVACVSSDRAPELALGTQLAAAGLLAAGWIPFALVPIAMAFMVVWRHRRAFARHVATRNAPSIAWVLGGFGVASVSFVVWAWPLLQTVVEQSASEEPSSAFSEVVTFSRPGYWESYTNPAWPPLAATVAVAALLVAWLMRDHYVARVAAVTTVVCGLGFVVVAYPVTYAWDALPYYPAKYLWVTTVILVTIAAALIVAAIRRHTPWHTRALAGVATVSIAAGLALAPPLKGIDWWGFTPWDVATGRHVGSHEDVAGRLLAATEDATLTLPWRLDPPYDTAVALMASAFSPGIDAPQFEPTRYVLRYYRNDFGAEVACELSRADTRPVRLLTADQALAAQVAAACPAEGIVVTVVD